MTDTIPPHQIEQLLRGVQQQISAGKFDMALEVLDGFRSAHPEENESLYMQAVCYRYTKNYDQALETLKTLRARVPEHGRAFQEEGHTYRVLQRTQEAIRAYANATRCNPALTASWKFLAELETRVGNQQAAKGALAQLQYFESLPKPLLATRDLISQGKILKAEDLCRAFLQKVPHHVEAMRLLADIGIRLGVLDDAEFLLDSAVQMEPDNLAARADYVQALRKRQKFDQALEQIEILLNKQPENLQFQSLSAIGCMQIGNYELAIRKFQAVLSKVPGDPATLTSLGHAQKTHGNYDAAVASFKAAYEANVLHGEAHYALANLKIYRFTDDEISRMFEIEQNPHLTHQDRVYLCFALGKAFEDRKEHGQAFEYYERGNQLKKVESRYDADQISEEMNAQRRFFTRAFLSERVGLGCQIMDPIFIVGLPRAGSTLLEQILASHSQVDGTLELPNIIALAQRLKRLGRSDKKGYPDVLDSLEHDQLRDFGESFIEETRIHRQGALFFIDKMPNNFRHIGLIKLILPNARIIDARRNAMSCCFSGYKQLFAEGQEFTYSLHDIGRYYRDYLALMNHWHDVLPGEILTVNHEDVVDNLEGEVRRILDFCGLPFEQSCVEYHKTERSVRTPSSEQVRQPIFRDSIDTWQNFEPWLDPLKQALRG